MTRRSDLLEAFADASDALFEAGVTRSDLFTGDIGDRVASKTPGFEATRSQRREDRRPARGHDLSGEVGRRCQPTCGGHGQDATMASDVQDAVSRSEVGAPGGTRAHTANHRDRGRTRVGRVLTCRVSGRAYGHLAPAMTRQSGERMGSVLASRPRSGVASRGRSTRHALAACDASCTRPRRPPAVR